MTDASTGNKSVEIDEYKGSKIIKLPLNGTNEKIKFSFGLNKARTILIYLEEIKQFIEEHS